MSSTVHVSAEGGARTAPPQRYASTIDEIDAREEEQEEEEQEEQEEEGPHSDRSSHRSHSSTHRDHKHQQSVSMDMHCLRRHGSSSSSTPSLSMSKGSAAILLKKQKKRNMKAAAVVGDKAGMERQHFYVILVHSKDSRKDEVDKIKKMVQERDGEAEFQVVNVDRERFVVDKTCPPRYIVFWHGAAESTFHAPLPQLEAAVQELRNSNVSKWYLFRLVLRGYRGRYPASMDPPSHVCDIPFDDWSSPAVDRAIRQLL